jgi:hypothetical protein
MSGLCDNILEGMSLEEEPRLEVALTTDSDCVVRDPGCDTSRQAYIYSISNLNLQKHVSRKFGDPIARLCVSSSFPCPILLLGWGVMLLIMNAKIRADRNNHLFLTISASSNNAART